MEGRKVSHEPPPSESLPHSLLSGLAFIFRVRTVDGQQRYLCLDSAHVQSVVPLLLRAGIQVDRACVSATFHTSVRNHFSKNKNIKPGMTVQAFNPNNPPASTSTVMHEPDSLKKTL